MAQYTPLIWIGGPVLLFVTILYFFLRADPKEVDRQTEEFYKRRYQADALNNNSRR